MSTFTKGEVVYLIVGSRRGKIASVPNPFTGSLAGVQWDDGQIQSVTPRSLISESDKIEKERLEAMRIKDEQAIIGAVVYLSGAEAPLRRGKIAGPITQHPTIGSIVIVEWDDGRLDKTAIKSLLPEADGIAENQRLLDEASRLEKEFAQVEQEIASKFSKAAELINEAAKLAASKNVDLQDMRDATRSLERAMDNAGWSTSSWHC